MGDARMSVLEVLQAEEPAVEQAAEVGTGPAPEPLPAYDWGQFGRDLAAWVQQAVAWCGTCKRR